jgi:hypothetical protein
MTEHHEGAPPRRPHCSALLTALGLGTAGARTPKEGRSDDEPEISNKLEPDAAKQRLSATPKGSTSPGEGHLRSTDSDQAHATSAGATIEKPPDRRDLIAAALGIGAAALLTKPKNAAADLSFGDVEGAVGSALRSVVRPLLQTINGTLRDIFNFFREIFALIGIQLPAELVRLINAILGLWDREGSYIGSGDVGDVLEASYPRDAVIRPDDQHHFSLERARLTRERVILALEVNREAALATGELFNAETEIHAAALASGSIAGLLEANNLLLQSIAMRLGHQTSQLAAIAQLLADPVMADSNAKEQATLIGRAWIGPDAETVAPIKQQPVE